MSAHPQSIMSNWYLTPQPIYKVQPSNNQLQTTLEFNELLLRDKNHGFPASKFNALIATNQGNELVFNWFIQELDRLILNNPNKRYSINIDPQQMLSNSFKTFVQKLITYRQQIIIELTERIPKHIVPNVFNQHLSLLIKHQIPVMLDDVDILAHNLTHYQPILQHIIGIKLSANTATQSTKLDLAPILNNFPNIDYIVGEGVSDLMICHNYLQNNIIYHQGWLFPHIN